MGGEVDGMVAIVQGLPDAGLAVTMMGREHGRQSNINAPPERLLQANSLIETSAWPVAADTAAQICDDRYTSTYQLAHCNARPTSPIVNLPEFPRQRAELCRTQGNFEIGTVDSPGTRSPIKINLYQRNGFSSPDRASLTTTQSSRGTEAFVSSLRKYPTVSPDNSISSDLVLRLISYTQAKNFSKGSYHSKSMRNLRNKRFIEQSKSPELLKNKSKSVQTYTQTEKTRGDEDSTKDPEASTSRYRSASPVHGLRSSRCKYRRSNETYDYLRSSSPRHFNRMMNVRYLNDVTRCLKDSMRQIYDDTPQVCPHFQGRYSRHRREHHNDLRAVSERSHNMEAQASLPLNSTGLPGSSTCQPTPGTYIQTCPLQPKTCCFCRKPLPCKCKRRPSAIQDEDDFFKSKLEEQVSAWLQEIPVFVNDTPDNQAIRENMVSDLIDKLKSLEHDDYFEQNANNEISECVANLPMWYPGDKRDQDLFKTQIIDNLMNKIRSISSESVNYKDEISKWIDDISFKSRDSEGQIVDKRSVKKDLVNRLNTLASNPPKYQTEKKSEIVDILNEFPIEVEGDKSTYISDLAETLADKMHTLPSKGRRDSETSTDKFQTFRRDSALLNQQVLEWIEDVPELQGSKLENQKAAAQLGKILKESLNLGKDASVIRDDISTWLNNTLERKGERLEPEHKNDLVKKLFNTVNTTPSKERRDSILLTKQVLEWMNDVPELQGSKFENQKIAVELGKLLKESLNQGKDASAVQDDISTWLTNTLESKGKRLDSKQKNDLVKKLFNTVNATPSKERRDSILLTKQVLEWMDDVPELQGSKLENQKIAAQLGKLLKESLNQGKDATAVQDDISTWLTNTLESKGKRLDSKQKNDLVKKLFDTVNTEPDKKNVETISNEIIDVLKDIPNLDMSTGESKNLVKELAKKMQELQSYNGDDSEAVKNEIVDWVNKLFENTGVNLNSKDKENLTNKLMAIIPGSSNRRKRWSKQENLVLSAIKDQLSGIFENNSVDIGKADKKEIQDKISALIYKNIDKIKTDDTKQITTDLFNILEEDARIPAKKAKQITDEILKKVKTMKLPRRRSSELREVDFVNSVNEEVGNVLGNSNVYIENKDEVEANLSNILADQAMRGENDEQTKARLLSVLINSNLSDEESEKIATQLMGKGKESRIPAKKANQTTDEILKKVKTMKLPRRRSSELREVDFVNSVNEEVGNVLGNSNVYIENKDEVEANLSNILADQTMRGENDEQTKARLLSVLINSNLSDEESEKIATQLMGKGKESRIPAKKANQTTDEILKKVKTMKLPRRRSSELREVDFVNSVNEEVGNVLGNSNVYIENKDEVEANLSNILADQAMRGENDEQTKARLLSVLINSNLSDEESEKIATQLMGKGKELLLSHRSQKSEESEKIATQPKRKGKELLLSHRSQKSESSQSFQTLPPMHKQMFVDSAQKEILDFTQDLTNDSGVSSRKKWEAAACELAENSGDIVSNPNTSSVAKKDLMKDAIVDYLENNDIQSGSDPKVQANKLVGKLKKVLKTSTPRNSDVDRSLYPSMSAIGYDSTSSQYQRQLIPTKEEVQYSSELLKKIDNWMKTLPIDIDSVENKDFKETMIKDLAGGMIDRQKYLQLNPNAKTSHEEELEHLKYQVFRWLNKLPDGKQLMPSLAKTHELMESIKAVPVPQLTRANTFRDSFTSQVPDLSLLEAEISNWIEAVPSEQYTSTDKYRQKQMIKKLAKNIQDYQKNNNLTEPVLDDMIIEWLEEMVNDSKHSLLNLSEGLKAILINKRIISYVQDIRLKREQSLKFKEDMLSLILGWLKEQPLYQRRNSMEKREQEQIFTQLSKALKDVSAAETNNLQKYTMLLEAIKSHLQRLPKDSHLVNDNKFLEDTANELLAHLKESNIYKEIIAGRSHTSQSTSTEPGFKKAADILFDNIENWCNNLPISGGDTPEEREQIKTLKQNICSKLINKIGNLNMNPEIFNDDALYEDILNDEIEDLLSSLPQTDELNNNKAALKDSLIDKIKEAKQKTQSELAGHAYKQQLRDAISTTLPSVQNLTIDEQVPFEILKDNLADAYINLHYSPENVELQNKLKQKIQDKLNTFCNDYLKRFPASPVDAQELNQQLYTALQKVPIPKDETIKAQVEQVKIKDAIHDWLKNIPVNDDSPAQQMQKNKIVSVLAKLLHETEKENNANPDIDVDDKMRKDITKWTNKLPLKPGAVSKIDKEVDKLIDHLKSTKDSRRFSISKLKSMADRSKTRTSQDNKYSQYSNMIPPSCLCLEDREHLEQIRQRAQRSSQYCPEMSLSKDAYVSPIPVDEGSQTDIGSQNHQPLSPNVVVNEYEWNSTDASRIQESYNGVETNPDMLGQSYPMMPQQMPPQYLQSQQQRMSWPQPNAQNSTSATPQNQYGSGPQTSCPMPPPCPLQSPCTRSRRLCTTSPPFSSSSVPCAPSPTPCAPPPLPCALPTRPCIPLLPPYAPPQPPCAPPSPPCAPSQLPYSGSEQPCTQPTPSYAHHQSACARQNRPSISSQAPCHPSQSPSTRSQPPCTRPPPPCSRLTLPCPTPQPPCYSPPQPCTPPSCMFQPSCIAPTPSMHRMRSYPSRLPNSPSSEVSPGPSKRWVPRQPQSVNSRDFSSTSSPFDEYPEGVMSRSFRQPPRVTRLGSLDDVPFTRNCGSQSPRAKPSRGSPCEESEWSIRPSDDYLGTFCTRRRPCRMPRNANGPLIKERKEDTIRCHCSRKPRANHSPCRRTDSMQRCSKCCGEYCPNPSYMFFR